ncbi:MAG: alpha-amylase family glycosyl hydrolase, partial [Pyrinomonadaceae bacterium]
CMVAPLYVVVAAPLANAPSVTKVEPPSWWAKHSINPVRLLVRGKNLAGATVHSSDPAIQTSGVRVNRSAGYVFVDLRISANAKPGSYPLTLATAAGKATIPFRIEPALDPRKSFQGITNDDVIYLIMPDRFANGEASNDKPPDAPAAATDRKNPRAYHGGDLRGIIDHLPYLKSLGVTALWLTPWYDNWNGVNTCDKPWCPTTYYHGYHTIDYYALEDRFGDMATLRELVEKAHVQGMKVIQDQVANHVGSRHPWVENPPLEDWFHGTLANHMLNKFKNSVLLSPHANREEFRNTLDGWFGEDLPDLNQEQPEVTRYVIQNSLWWVGVTGIDGIRQDTIQYMPRKFIRDLSDALHRQYATMWMVGEVYELDAAQTAFFIGGHTGWDGLDTKLDSVFDFSLWNASRRAFTHKLPVHALRDQLKYDALYPDPARVTTMLNNHDTMRFMSLPGASLEGAMLHMAFTLSTRGTPQLYYGEEIAMEGGDDPDNRRDFPGGFPGDSRNGFEAAGRTATEQRMYEWTRSWLRLRAEHEAIRRGRLIDLFYDDDAYVFARQVKSETVIVGINRAEQDARITVSAEAIGLKDATQIVPLLGASGSGRIAQGNLGLKLPAKSAVAYGVR